MGFRTKDSVGVGSKAPDFTLSSQSGEMVNLTDLLGSKPVVLFFYPNDDTPGCTKQACAYRDDYEEFGKLDVEVIGISSDSVESHKSFPQSTICPSPYSATRRGKCGDSTRYQVPSA